MSPSGLNKKQWGHLHHDLFTLLARPIFQNKKFLVMVSGGGDSIAALKLWTEVVRDQSRFAVFHYHHGSGQNALHRDSAQRLVESTCVKHNISFIFAQNTNLHLTSEADLRRARYEAAQKIMTEQNFDFLVTAHHQEDLLETRLIRLIRGTSLDGLRAIPMLKSQRLRPWIRTSQKELRKVLLQGDSSRWSYLDDPTNSHEKILRNWIRRSCLPQLESFNPGSVSRLAKSLDLVLQKHREQKIEPHFTRLFDVKTGHLDQIGYMELEGELQKRLIARIYRELDQKNFTSFGIFEVMKQLDKTKEGHTFKVQGLTWHISDRCVKIKTCS